MVMDKVMAVIDSVMTETIASDECDGCDGKIKKSFENDERLDIKAHCNTVNQGQLEKNDSVEEFSNMPSPSSQEEAESYTALSVTDDYSKPSSAIAQSITVGAKVTIFDCPGHWGWASPFTVEAIEGQMVKLEMIEELVEISKLEKCSK